MREPPFYDPVFIAEDKRDDPDVVLEARAELWNIDRITHVVSSSDVLVGEDGNEDFQDSEVPYDSVARPAQSNSSSIGVGRRNGPLDAMPEWVHSTSSAMPVT